MTVDGMETLARIARRVEGELSGFFGWTRDRVPGSRDETGALLEAVAELTLRGGKRLRPALAYLAAVSIRPETEIPGLLGACSALELLQSYLLIHDDIMDDDDVRRGGPAVHLLLTPPPGDAAGRLHGRNLGILAGDLACVAARMMVERSGAAQRHRALDELARMEWEVIHGQMLDVGGSADVDTMHDLKTGSYTTRGPVRFGAALAGAPPEALEALLGFANPLGLAFKLRDDLLDVCGDPGKTGKPRGTDLREGRRSAVIREALDRADPAARSRLEAAWGAGEALSGPELDAALFLLRGTGAVEACATRVAELSEQAAAALAGVPLRPEGREGLESIALALAARVT